MGGKQKQAQRTKNNARPSSSGRSAELLGNSSGKLFSTLNESTTFISTTNSQDIDSSINQEFQLTIKKMSKKDPLTRQKALQEFADLCQTLDPSSVRAVLPFWPRLYSSLATDVDFHVREAAQQAHRAIVMAVKRNIAPYLKQLMGTWFVSSFDAHPAAANIARNSFQIAFSPPKRTEAIVFAQKEILDYITQNIIYETPESLSNSKNFLADEVQVRYQKVVSCNLLGYAHYLNKLSEDQLLVVKDDNKHSIVNTNKFWKFAKDDSKAVKASWFTAILSLIDKAPSFLEDSQKKLCTSVFQNLDDSDSNVLPLVWETAIHTCNLVPNWWVHASPNKLIYPKLWRVLQAAGFGNASVIYPLLLPLISKIQVPDVTDMNEFYSKLFSKIITGLSTVKLLRNASEAEAILTALNECLRYFVKINLKNKALCLSLIDNVLVLLVKNMLNDNTYGNNSTMFVHLSNLLRYWSRLHCTSNVYQEVTEKVFSSIHMVLKDSVTCHKNCKKLVPDAISEKDELENKLRIHLKIITALKNPGDIRSKKPSKLTSNLIDEEKSDTTESSVAANDNHHFSEQLHKVVDNLIRVYFSMTLKSEYSFLFVNQLCYILNLFSNRQYYQRLTDIAIELSDTNDNDSSQLINNLIRKWLSDNRVSVDAVLNVVFHLLVYLKDEEKVSILKNISEDHMSCMLDLCLNLANDNQLQSSIQKWLSSSYFRSTLNSFAHEVSKVWPPSVEKVNVLKTCFKSPKNGENYTNDETKLEILKVFRESLLHNNGSDYSSPQQLHKDNLSCIAEVLKEVFKKHNHPLIKANHATITSTIGYLFLYGCDVDNQVKSDDILNEAWVLGVETLATIFGCTSPDFINVTEQFAFAVMELVEKSKCGIHDMKQIIQFVCTYIECLPMASEVKKIAERKEDVRHNFDNEGLSPLSSVHANITSLICEVFLKISVQYCRANMEYNVVSACLTAEFYNGSMTCRYPLSHREPAKENHMFNNETKITGDVNECLSSIAKLFNVAYYIVTVIDDYLFVTPRSTKKGDTEDGSKSEPADSEEMNRPFLSKNGLEKLNEGIVYAVYLLAVLKSFHKNFKHARYYDQISESDLKELYSITSKIVEMHPRSPILLLKLSVMNKAFECGGFWAKALFLLFTKLMDTNGVNDAYYEILKCHDVSDHKNKSFILHISELFATVSQLKVETYSPDAKLDEEKLSILTCYLRANKDSKFTSDQDRVIWYWLDTILIQKKQLEVTFNKNLTECSVSDIMLAATVCRFLSVVSDGKIPLMTDKRTDFMMIALASWMQSVHKTCSNPAYEDSQYSMPVCIFVSAVCDMFKSVTKLASHAEYSDKLFIEWNNVFASETHTIISFSWKCLAESERSRNVEQFLVLNTLSNLIMTDVKFFPFVVRPDLNFWLCACSDLIQNYCTLVRLAAYFILEELSLEMVSQDSCVSVVEDMDEKLTLEILSISSLQTIVNIVLSSYNNGDSRVLDPNTDSYVYVHSYLLVWMVVIRMCENAPAQVRYRYASWLKEEGYLEIFLHNLFTLMPDRLHNNNLSDATIKKFSEYFSTEMKFTSEDRWDVQKLNLFACRLYYMTLWLLPAFVRQWWKSLEHKDAITVDKLTTKFVSPALILEEMKAIKREKPLEKFCMKGYPTSRQIIAVYTIEDTYMEITMEVAVNHPLGIVKVDSSKVGVLSNRWKTWAKQLNMYLAHQNGLIRDGIMSWKSNVDKAFEGVEECYICFSIVHSSNYQLPKQSCKTCHKKFHPLCLYRWFITSNKSSCPICRNHF